MKYRKQTQHFRRYRSGRFTYINIGIYYKSRPKKIGSHWVGEEKKFVHGPRILDPDKFKYGPYNWSQSYARKRKKQVVNWDIIEKSKLPKSTKLKIGGLKNSKGEKNLAVQSFITPLKEWKKVNVPPYKKEGVI